MVTSKTHTKETSKSEKQEIKDIKPVMSEPLNSSKLSLSQTDEASPINYARVVILGDGGVGKTALIKVIIWQSPTLPQGLWLLLGCTRTVLHNLILTSLVGDGQ